MARIKGRECRCDLIAASESEEEDEEDLGGHGSSRGAEEDTLSYGNVVRRTGPLISTCPFVDGSSFVFLGSVSAQFSHGMALFLSFSS